MQSILKTRQYDDEVAHIATSAFGGSPSSVSVNINGNINFNGNADRLNTALPGGTRRISPFWDDLLLNAGRGGSIVSYESPGAYLAVNWNGLHAFAQTAGPTSTFQAVIFGGNVTLNGANFTSGDIVFSYASLAGEVSGLTATVGINLGDGQFSPVPGTTDGIVTDDTKAALLPTDNRYLLFRPNGSGGQVASVVVPEPAEYAAVAGLALVAFGAWRRTRRTRRFLSPHRPGPTAGVFSLGTPLLLSPEGWQPLAGG